MARATVEVAAAFVPASFSRWRWRWPRGGGRLSVPGRGVGVVAVGDRGRRGLAVPAVAEWGVDNEFVIVEVGGGGGSCVCVWPFSEKGKAQYKKQNACHHRLLVKLKNISY